MSNLYVKHIKKNSNSNIFAFSALNTPAGKFQFYKTLSDIDYNLTLVNVRDNDWYQRGIPGIGEDVPICANQFIKNVEGKGKTICIGSSMGGYGAGLYGARGHADIVIIFGSEFRIGLPFSRSKLHMPDDIPIKYGNLSEIIKQSNEKTKYYVFVGDTDIIDLYNSTFVSDIPSVTIYNIKNSNHNVTKFINDNIISLSSLVEKIVAEDSSTHEIISPHLSYSIDSSRDLISSLYQAYIAIRTREFNTAKIILDTIKSPYSLNNELYNLYYGMTLIRLKTPAKALPFLSRSIKIGSQNRDTYFELGMAYNHVGKTTQSIQSYTECLKIDSSYAPAHHHLGLIYKQENELYLSESHLRSAYLTSKSVRYKKDLVDVLNMIIKQKSEEIETMLLTQS